MKKQNIIAEQGRLVIQFWMPSS